MENIRESEPFYEKDHFQTPDVLSQVGLFIGINNYSKGFKPLENAERDAQSMGDLLNQEFNYRASILLNENANKDQIENSLSTALNSPENTRFLFYFAGHGTVLNGNSYLIPFDAEKGEEKSYINLLTLLKSCVDSKVQEILLILDACYSGRALIQPDKLSDWAPKANQPDRLRQIITSGNTEQPVLDGGGNGHSIFAQSLLEALQGWAGIHDSSIGLVHFNRLLDHLSFDIPLRLHRLGVSASQQHPLGGYFLGLRKKRFDFVFQPNISRLPPEIIQGCLSEDPSQRIESLAKLPLFCKENSYQRSLAIRLISAHLKYLPGTDIDFMITNSMDYEPVPSVRAFSAEMLGKMHATEAEKDLILSFERDEEIVCKAASKALGLLRSKNAIQPLLQKLQKAGDQLFLDIAEAIGSIGDNAAAILVIKEALQRGKLVPFIGPDLPHDISGVIDRTTFCTQYAKRYGIHNFNSFTHLAEIATHNGSTFFTMAQALKDSFSNPLLKPGIFYKELSSLSCSFWLSACYDKLLAEALEGNDIVMGDDTKYWRSNRPTIVRVLGDPGSLRGLVVLANDYDQLRENEGDRKLLVSLIRQEIEGKIILFIGFNPNSSDFKLLIDRSLNNFLKGVNSLSFIVSSKTYNDLFWNGRSINQIEGNELNIVRLIKIPNNNS